MQPIAQLIVVSCLLGQAESPRFSYADAVRDVHQDLAEADPYERVDYRYFLMHNYTAKEKRDAIDVMMGHPHFLSRSATIENNRPVLTDNQLALRINYKNYFWTKELFESIVDPYTSVPTYEKHEVIKTWPAGVPWGDGKTWGDGKAYSHPFTYKDFVNGKKANGFAPWLLRGKDEKERAANKKMLDDIYKWTGNSQVPFIRGDYFFNQTAASENRNPSYYEFLGIKDEKTYHKLVGFDEKLAKSFRVELRESVSISGVTRKPRAIARYGAQGGGLWKSIDFLKDQKAILIFGRDIEKEYDATEQFGFLPNGFWAVGAFDGKGVLQRIVPTEIAGDKESKSSDLNIHNGVSCFRCHWNGGLKDINEYVRKMVRPPVNIQPADYDEHTARELREAYLANLKKYIKQDREVFNDAVKLATRLESSVYLKKYGRYWELYEDRVVNASYAAWDMGIPGLTEMEFVRKLDKYNELYKKAPPDQRLHPLLAPLITGGEIAIREWEIAYSFAQQVMDTIE